MVTRIVKMTFAPETVDDFLTIYREVCKHIAAFDGCQSVKLVRGTSESSVLFTISEWTNEERLNAYRNSSLFENTWARTKVLFAAKAQAWSTQEVTD